MMLSSTSLDAQKASNIFTTSSNGRRLSPVLPAASGLARVRGDLSRDARVLGVRRADLRTPRGLISPAASAGRHDFLTPHTCITHFWFVTKEWGKKTGIE